MPFAMKDGRPFGIAGLWENWKEPQSGEWMRTFAIITTDANDLVAQIHNKMPLILAPRDYTRWLSEELRLISADIDPLQTHALEIDTPSTIVNRARTYRCTRMRRCIEQSNGLVPSVLCPSWVECIIATRGYDFRKGRVLEIVSGMHIIADLTLPLGKVVHDYLG
jgi:hypothetical protein